jgi:hypothetical protein
MVPRAQIGDTEAGIDQVLALPQVEVASDAPSSSASELTLSPATSRVHTALRNSLSYRLGMDYLLVAHDQTLITLVPKSEFRSNVFGFQSSKRDPANTLI